MDEKQIAAMVIACIAEEIGTEVNHLRVISFREVPKSSLEDYIAKNNISYKKYQLGDELL